MDNIEKIANPEALEDLLSKPHSRVIEMMKRLDGDIMILGIGGKMGVTLGRQAVNAIKAAGVSKKVIGVSRFSDSSAQEKLNRWGIETIAADLLDRDAVNALPPVKNIIYMAGRKFGTAGSEELTWAMNTIAPALVAEHFKQSRIVAFSTGCVYPLVDVKSGGSTEADLPAPIGEYSQSCLGRERIFGHYSKLNGTPMVLFRLNYAVDLRYGVLHDIAKQIINGEKVSNSVGYFNVIWQGDANASALLSLEHCASPAAALNVTGPETVSIEYAAKRLGALMQREVGFSNPEAGGRCYLSNAAESFSLFGYPEVSLDTMIRLQAEWLLSGNSSLGKPTHFEVNDGKF